MARLRRVGAIWGIAGVIALLLWAVVRLTPNAIVALQSDLSALQWVVLVVWVIFMVITEGYDGFYRRLAPRISERANNIAASGDMLDIILAPLYCFGYFRAPIKRMAISYTVIVLIVCAILIVQQVSQPWRGIIDTGVVLGLICGAISIVVVAVRQKIRT